MTLAQAVVGDILVPLDGSERSEIAIDVALQLAMTGRGRVTLLIVTEAETVKGLQEYASAENVSISQTAETYLEQLIDRLGTSVALEPVTISGTNAAEEILAFAERDGSSMIVMTSRGRSPLNRLLLGSVTDRTVRLSPVPVVVVPSLGAPPPIGV